MKKKIIVLVLLLVMLCGCTKRAQLVNEDNSTKSYVTNIICRPESEELVEAYDRLGNETKVDYSELPACKDLKIN